MIGALATWAVEALVASALLMVFVLAVRVPVRRFFGPRVAYALWLLPVLRLVLPSIPASWHHSVAETPISRMGESITVVFLPGAAAADPVISAAAPSLASMMLLAWAVVAAGFLLYHLASHLAFCRRVMRGGVTVERIARIRVVESPAAAGPMAFGLLRPTVALPADFAERFDAEERALAVAHELGHHARGDLLANWIALAVLALHWFNPLAWRAFRAFRADQELATDARVLAGRSPYERHAYACAIVKAAHGRAFGAACHLHSVSNLKGRLLMLRTRFSARRLAAGAAIVGSLSIAALALTASGTRAAERVRTEVAEVTGIDLTTPETPETAETPETPVVPATPSPGGRSSHRVVIVKNGVTTVYEGEAARRYVAEHPAPVPPRPPRVPTGAAVPLPPAPPAAAVYIADADGVRFGTGRQVTSARCGTFGVDRDELIQRRGQGAGSMVICTDRISRMAGAGQHRAWAAQRSASFAVAHAEQTSAAADRARRDMLRQALAGLRRNRDAIGANRVVADDVRDEAVDLLDREIDRLDAEIDRLD